MAFKLYPPVIGSRIPAFYQRDDDTIEVIVPFINNRSVSLSDISDIVLRIKTIQTDWVAITSHLSNSVKEAYESGFAKYEISLEDWKINNEKYKMNVGQFYKIQLAYQDKDANLGYYSSIGISKFSFYPEVTIENMDGTHKYTYIGKYSQMYETILEDGTLQTIPMDITEKVYNYKFIIKNEDKIIYDTDWLLHDSRNDINEAESYDSFEYLGEVSENTTIQYLIKTTSGINAESPVYQIGQQTPQIESSLICEAINNFDDGFIQISIFGDYEADNYYIVRNIVGDNNKYKIASINLGDTFKDFTVEQGIEYEYRIYALKNNTYISSNSTTAYADYEDIFLFDGTKQLKVRFNPSVNSLVETIMESKVDTIGGKYPIFLRNGDTRYFTFSFGGLITYNMDEKGYFDEGFAKQEYIRESTETNQDITIFSNTVQNAYNYKRERDFREKVLAWLNNGEPKLYRSSTEGIKLVRLINNSLSPNQQVSRMIWSFSSNATEFDNHDYETLVKYKIYNV